MATKSLAYRYPVEDWFAWYPVREYISGKWLWLCKCKRRNYYMLGMKGFDAWRSKED
jgi:hypothetical protein